MKLHELAQQYVLFHQLAGESAACYLRTARYAETVLNKQDIQALEETDFGSLLQAWRSRYRPETIQGHFRRLKTMLQFAWQMRLINQLPRVWPKIRATPQLPEAWTAEEVARFYRVAIQQPGRIGPHPAGDWWRAFLSTAWDTGMRVSQMFRLRLADVDWRRRCLIVQACPHTKSYRPQIKPLAQETLWALAQIAEPAREMLFSWPEWPKSRRDFFSVWRYLCWLADVPAPRTPRQLTHRWRRSSITQAALGSLEAARRQAGHASPEVTLRHYIDPRLLAQGPPPVPSLERISKANGFLWDFEAPSPHGDGKGNGRKI